MSFTSARAWIRFANSNAEHFGALLAPLHADRDILVFVFVAKPTVAVARQHVRKWNCGFIEWAFRVLSKVQQLRGLRVPLDHSHVSLCGRPMRRSA